MKSSHSNPELEPRRPVQSGYSLYYFVVLVQVTRQSTPCWDSIQSRSSLPESTVLIKTFPRKALEWIEQVILDVNFRSDIEFTILDKFSLVNPKLVLSIKRTFQGRAHGTRQ